MKKAILYLRFSDPKQTGNTSLETQEAVCRNSCSAEGFEVVNIVKNEAVSANSTNTHRVIELLDFCKGQQGKFDVLMVYKLDRFARSQEQHHWLRGQLLKLNIVLRSATETINESPSGKLVEGVLASVNEYDNSIKKERVKLALWARVDQGLWPWIPPLGYKPNRQLDVKLSPAAIDDTCADTVRQFFKTYSSGLVSITQLSKTLAKRRIVNYKGRIVKFSKQTLHRILSNRYYIGLLPNKDGKLVQGKHKPLVDISLFERCQVVMQGLSNHNTRKRLQDNPDFPLRRFVTCGHCYKPLTACWSRSKNGTKHPYYYCVNKICDMYSRMVKKAEMENSFMEYLRKVKPTDKFIERFKTRFMKRYTEREQEIKGDYFRQMDEITALQGQLNWVVSNGSKGVLPGHVVQDQVKELDEKITFSKMRLTDTHAEELDVNALLAYSETFIRTLEITWLEAPFMVKQQLQRAVFPEGVIYDFPSFSNTKISLAFNVISSLGANNYSNVTPRGIEPRFSG